MDEATKGEAQQLERVQQHEQELRETQARLGALRRETARTQITKNEIDGWTKIRKSIARGQDVFVERQEGRRGVTRWPDEAGEERTAQLTARAQFAWMRRVPSRRRSSSELVKQATAQWDNTAHMASYFARVPPAVAPAVPATTAPLGSTRPWVHPRNRI